MLDKTASDVSYRGNGGQSVFPIPFPFFENSHIEAHIARGGAQQPLTAGVEYTINRISDGYGELILLGDPLTPDAILIIRRRVPLTQEILFHNQGPNSPRAAEEAVDKLTMIAQQLQVDIDNRLPVPDGADAGEMAGSLAELGEFRDGVAAALGRLDAEKADRVHTHAASDIADLGGQLAAKADSQAVVLALSTKAGKADLLEKADLAHRHGVSDVDALADALAAKASVNDPRIVSHAARHASGGADPVSPWDIGALAAPPADGNPYLAAAGGWIRYYEPGVEPGGGGGTLDHAQLLNRDAADQHPQSAIQNLERDLGAMRTALADVTDDVLEKADRDELPDLASAARDGLMSSIDKVRLDAMKGGGLPDGGTPRAFLAADDLGTPVWKTPATAAASLPLMSETAPGVAMIAPGGGLAVDSAGRLGLAAGGLGVETIRFTGDGVATVFELPHNLGTKNVLVQVYNEDDGGLAHFGVTADTDDRVVLTADPARPQGENYRVLVAARATGGGEGGAALPPGQAPGRILGSDSTNVAAWLTGVQVADFLPVATGSQCGLIRPDNETTFVGADGLLTAIGGSGGSHVVTSTNQIIDAGTNETQTVVNTGFRSDITALETALSSKAGTASPAFSGTPTAPTAPAGTATGQIASTKFVHDVVEGIGGGGGTPFPLMIGTMFPYFGPLADMSALPDSLLFADGSVVSRTQYSELFAAYGTRYGEGDGVTTFGIPDLRGVFVRGLDAGRGLDPDRVLGVLQGDAIRNVTGAFGCGGVAILVGSDVSGAFTGHTTGVSTRVQLNGTDPSINTSKITLDLSTVVPTAAENRPVNMACNWVILARSPAMSSASDFTAAIAAVAGGLASKAEADAPALSLATQRSHTEYETGRKDANGRKIYAKTMDTGALPNNTTKSVAHNIANVMCIEVAGGRTTNGTAMRNMPCTASSSAFIDVYGNASSVVITTVSAWAGYNQSEVDIEYTCTDR